MASPLNIRDFLHDVLANKARTKLTIEEFDSLLNMVNQVQKFSEKGLLIVTLTQQLHKMSNVNFVSIKKFMNEFLNGLKPEKPRRQREQGQPRRRRPRPAEQTNVPRDINGMAEESISHPSNLQMARFGAENQSQQSQMNMISENASKKSDQNKKDFEFAEQLNKISQGVELITGQEYEQQQQEQLQEYSKASSSSQSFGVVSNLSEKMDLLNFQNREEKGEKRTKTIRRPPGVEATFTKKKGTKANVVDQNLTLEKTRATLNESVYAEDRQISYEYSPWIDQYHYQNDLFEMTNDEYLEVTKEKPLSMLENIMLSTKKNQERRDLYEIPADLTQFDTGFSGEAVYDFTSQPLGEYTEQFEASQIHMNELSIFKYEDANPTITEISAKVNRSQAQVFYEMLLKMQKGEITMTQQNVKEFSQIRVQLNVV